MAQNYRELFRVGTIATVTKSVVYYYNHKRPIALQAKEVAILIIPSQHKGSQWAPNIYRRA